TGNLIELEESARLFMYDVLAHAMGEVFTKINEVVKDENRCEGWTVERNDTREVQFTFGAVSYKHTLMYDLEGNAHYPFDEWIGLKKYHRRSPFVEIKVAEMASE